MISSHIPAYLFEAHAKGSKVPTHAWGGPLDVIGDVHGCHQELETLLSKLGYDQQWHHPQGRLLCFLGDVTDRGPGSLGLMQNILEKVHRKSILYVPGNHCLKIKRWSEGHEVTMGHGFTETLEAINTLSPTHRQALLENWANMIEQLPPYLMLDDGQLVLCHAGLKEDMLGLDNREVRFFSRMGHHHSQNHGSRSSGKHRRYDWAKNYCGQALIVYGHSPVPEPLIRHNTLNIDQGCVYGGKLTAFRYPEKQCLSVPAQQAYFTEYNPLSEPIFST